MRQADKLFTVYLVTNKPRGVFYFGLTSDLLSRVLQHRAGTHGGFSAKWRLRTLVWYETLPDAESAIAFEKKLKRWRRTWKIAMVDKFNPDWRDLGPDIGAGEFSA